MIYLDNAATTEVYPEVVDAMLPYLRSKYGNPGSKHSLGRDAKKAVDHAREQVASLIKAQPEQIIFTSGGTEANNLAAHIGFRSSFDRFGTAKAATTMVEHSSMLRALRYEFYDGVKYIDPNASGLFILPTDSDIGFVSIMHTNNETGEIHNLNGVAEQCACRDILFHTDCVQAAGFSKLDVNKIGCDMMSLSSHKIHGAKGVGALYVKDIDSASKTPLLFGGKSQEFGVRGGTENVPGIVGFGVACEIAERNLCSNQKKLNELRTYFISSLVDRFKNRCMLDNLRFNGTGGKVVNFRIDGVDGETMLTMLDNCGVFVSAGSACDSHESTPSHVLKAIGLSDEQARSSIRVSFATTNTKSDVCRAVEAIASCALTLLHMKNNEVRKVQIV